MKNIIIITSNAIRHNYFKILFSSNKNINVLRTYVEGADDFKLNSSSLDINKLDDLEYLHFLMRTNTEYDFFSNIIENCNDNSKSRFIEKNFINKNSIVQEIIELNPDLIITYGCSIIKSSLIDIFSNRIINVHLGISPYYFGAGTNFHALVNNDFQCEGYTFMYMDEGIDTGEIIHQSRAKIYPFDNPHQIGNRLIKQMTNDFINLIINFEKIKPTEKVTKIVGKTYKIKDATKDLTFKLYKNFRENAVLDYLKNQQSLCIKYPLIEQSFLKENDD